jgi:hypothetical protein
LALRVRLHADSQTPPDGEEPPPFGEPIPAGVSRIRIIVESGDQSCCVKFDPRSSLFDDRRRLVLTGFAPGPASVDVAGFATSLVPTEGIEETCAVKQPLGVGESCDETACAQVSLSADASTDATLVAGRETIVTVSPEPRPFVVSATPPCDGEAPDNPIEVSLVVAELVPESDPGNCTCADGILECDGRERSVSVEVLQKDSPSAGSCSEVPLPDTPRRARISPENAARTCCRDDVGCRATSSCCTIAPAKADAPGATASDSVLTGMRIDLTAFDLQPGCAEVRVDAADFPSGTVLPVRHSFRVRVPPPPTPTPTPTPTLTPTLTPTPTVTAKPTAPRTPGAQPS